MDLVEEKRLLSDDSTNAVPKFSIDQVRLIKSVLEIMKSGRESSGWLVCNYIARSIDFFPLWTI